MELPVLTTTQKNLLGQYWGYVEGSDQSLDDLIYMKIVDYTNNILIEQSNRNALEAAPDPVLINVESEN